MFQIMMLDYEFTKWVQKKKTYPFRFLFYKNFKRVKINGNIILESTSQTFATKWYFSFKIVHLIFLI